MRDRMTDIMVWRNGQWLKSNLTELPPHSHGKPEECDRCNAELYWDLQRTAAQLRKTRPMEDA